MEKKIAFLLLLVALGVDALGQLEPGDSLQQHRTWGINEKALILPSALITYGFVGIRNEKIKTLNDKIKCKIVGDSPKIFKLDDFSLFAPSLTVYGLNALGNKGRNNFKDRSLIIGTAFALVGVSVLGLKNSTAIQRPDGSTFNSFPSGHTATAFAGAEFLWQEYRNVSVWYGVAGYIVAAGTGYLRIYNNRHWFTDVATGAGIGILSTKIAYLLSPVITKILSKKTTNTTGLIVPYYARNQYGLSFSLSF